MEKLYKKLLAVLCFCSPVLLYGQTLTGKITNPSGIPLSGINVHIQGLTSALSNNNGEYFYKLPSKGSYRLKVLSKEYQSQTQDIFVNNKSINQNFVLSPIGTVTEKKAVTGTRSTAGTTMAESSFAIDIITAEELKMHAQKDITQILSYRLQSFNSNRQTLSDGSDHIDPVSLRGLGPDQLLILVNGKRRHSTALVNVEGTFGRGSAGTDMNSIPVSSVERIEIMRDGAVAQYGSDAIGGVINIILKSNSPFNMSMSYGQAESRTMGRSFNDGKMFQVDYSEGINLAGRGSLNFSGQYLYRGATNRGGFDTRPLLYSALPNRGNCECEEDFQKRYGQLKANDDRLAFTSGLERDNMRVGNAESANGGLMLNGQFSLLKNVELYLTAGYTIRSGEAAGFFRLPGQSTQIDLTMYPNGFLPLINTGIQDLSVASGLRGNLLGWNYDVSHISGKNNINYHISRTLNASMPLGTSPSSFNAGDLYFRQNTSNLDLSRKFNFGGFLKSLNTGFGAEYRVDNYEIGQGEELSYSFGQPSKGISGRKLGSNFTAAGSQVFPGFAPENAINRSRNNQAVYADFEAALGSRFHFGLAGRLENFSDFGSNLSYKTTGRFNFYKGFSARGSFSTGFRAPSLHQQYFNNSSTAYFQKNTTQVLIANQESPILKELGLGALKPELSNSLSFGLTGKITDQLSFTTDAYQINIDDRIILTGALKRERAGDGTMINSGGVNKLFNAFDPASRINSVQYFANALSTQTRGVDFMLMDRFKLRKPGQNITLSAGINLNQTMVTNVHSPDVFNGNATLKNNLFSRQERSMLETAIPDNKLNLSANYTAKLWGIALRTVRFGEITYLNQFDPALPESSIPLRADQTFSPKWITDLTVNYTFTNELNFALGVNNLLDIYPDRVLMDPNNTATNFSGIPATNYNASAARDNSENGRVQYSRNITQFGFNGRHIFGKLSYSL